MLRGWVYILVLVMCMNLAVGVWADTAPDALGNWSWETFETQLQDKTRNRSMDLRVFYPLAADATGVRHRPLIIFNHGFLLSAAGYHEYGERLASHGFVVAMPSFPTSFFSVHHVKLAQDVRFVIDYLLAATEDETHPLCGLIDPSRIGSSGHSLGGKLSLLEAVTDDRIRACAVLDPVDEGNPLWDDPVRYPSVAPELMPELHIPLMFIGAELGSVLVFFSPCAPEDENYERFYEAANSPAIEITQLDVGHGQYVDRDVTKEDDPCATGDVSGEWVRSSSSSYLVAFFLSTLCEDTAAGAWMNAQLLADEEAGRITVRRK